MRPKWGQHFLVNKNVARRMVGEARLTPEDTVLEIGPGRGVLTELIVPQVKRMVCVEIDEKLAQKTQKRFENLPVTVIEADFLELDLERIFSKQENVKILANVPYGITAPILGKLTSWNGWEEGWLMVQREVAKRIQAQPGTKDYGILSIAVQLWCEAKLVMMVSPGSFKPPPKVDSAIVHLTRLPKPRITLENETNFFRIVKAAFGQRRKTLLNSLSHGLKLEKNTVKKALSQAGIDHGRRAETLTLNEFSKISSIS